MRIGFIEIGFKLRFMLIFCLITLTAVFIASALFYFLTYRELSSNYGEAFFTLQLVKKMVFPLLFASIQSILLLGLVSLAIAVLSLFFSHKIAGPIYRFEKSLEAIGSGDLTHIVRLRTGDQIIGLVEPINKSTRAMNHRIRTVQKSLLRLKAIEDDMKALLDKGYSESEMRNIIGGLENETGKLKDILQVIKLEGQL
ncbi:MAG: methyl-accepting chemotaxis protein [Deltaproteobacteria bacterium]|nr:methyl-accepting chemotaxis protein [Deltaproteobacteria bacterium]